MFPWGWPFSLVTCRRIHVNDNIQFGTISVRVCKNDKKHNAWNKVYYILVLWNFTIVLCDSYYEDN